MIAKHMLLLNKKIERLELENKQLKQIIEGLTNTPFDLFMEHLDSLIKTTLSIVDPRNKRKRKPPAGEG